MTDRDLLIKALRAYGHTAAKALEIAIDAERGSYHAAQWCNRALDHLYSQQMSAK